MKLPHWYPLPEVYSNSSVSNENPLPETNSCITACEEVEPLAIKSS